jgi:two-component system sensor histidine kinase DegS
VEFSEEGKPSSLDKSQETLLYRIVQESVSNALRHAQAKKINVVFLWEEQGLRVLVKDDGIGFDFPREKGILKSRQGLGLINVENRVTLLEAQLQFGKNDPSGTIVNLLLPIPDHG